MINVELEIFPTENNILVVVNQLIKNGVVQEVETKNGLKKYKITQNGLLIFKANKHARKA